MNSDLEYIEKLVVNDIQNKKKNTQTYSNITYSWDESIQMYKIQGTNADSFSYYNLVENSDFIVPVQNKYYISAILDTNINVEIWYKNSTKYILLERFSTSGNYTIIIPNEATLFYARFYIATGKTVNSYANVYIYKYPLPEGINNKVDDVNDLFIENLFATQLYKNISNEPIYLCDNKLQITKTNKNGELKLSVAESFSITDIENYNTRLYNLLQSTKENYPFWLTDSLYYMNTGLDWLRFEFWLRLPDQSSGYQASRTKSDEWVYVNNYNATVIRLFVYGDSVISAGDYYIKPSLCKGDEIYTKFLSPNNYFKNINYKKYDINNDKIIDLNLFTKTGFSLLSNGTVYLNAPNFVTTNRAYHIDVYDNYSFILQKVYCTTNPNNTAIRIYSPTNSWSKWYYHNNIEEDSIEKYKGMRIIDYERINGFYNANLELQESITVDGEIKRFDSALIPITDIGFIPNYALISSISTLSLAVLDNNKIPIKYMSSAAKQYTNADQDYASMTYQQFIFKNNVNWETAKYFSLPVAVDDNDNYASLLLSITFGTHDKCIILGCYLEEDELTIVNGKIINKTPTYELNINNWHNYMAGIADNRNEYNFKYNGIINNELFMSYDRVYFPAGTKINCLPSANINISLRGLNADGYIYYQTSRMKSWDGFIIPKDTYASICCNFGTWNHWGDKFDMNYLTKLEKCQFVTVQSPEELSNNPWKGLNWYAYGTSITDIGLQDTTGNNGHSGKYPLYLDMHSGLIRHNGAIGSGGIFNKPENRNYKKNILATPADADLVTLEVLPNDTYTQPSLGTIYDTGNDTLCGNLNQCLDYLVNNTHARIVFIFVTSSSAPNNIGSTDPNKPMYDSLSTARRNYRTAVNLLKELAELYGIYCIDVDKDIYPYEQRNWGNLFADWIHPSYLGGWVIGKYVWDELKKIRPMLRYPDIDQEKSTMDYSNETS